MLLVVHGGLSDEAAWAKVAAELTASFRVVRIRRRLYRTELPADPATDVAREADDVLALAAELAEPVVVVGHSSGAVVALETVVRDIAPFRGVVVYEPPLVLDDPSAEQRVWRMLGRRSLGDGPGPRCGSSSPEWSGCRGPSGG